ncbi:hemin uptake protein HemP [Leminorella grimontii]|uniref:hemin uptake protein HemP n=1 Tax=Leminorella grimontii TaxID=82981 RepID=UPI0028529BD1|nr:hemin uptake protein HemP [Leminorella grimontii]
MILIINLQLVIINTMASTNLPSLPQSEPSLCAEQSTKPAQISSRELLGESGILLIEHQNQQYQLRITKTGKLILTK